jgi:hypothetical protein
MKRRGIQRGMSEGEARGGKDNDNFPFLLLFYFSKNIKANITTHIYERQDLRQSVQVQIPQIPKMRLA